MGVLARLFRRSKSVEEPATEDTTATAEAPAEATADAAEADTVKEDPDSRETTEAVAAAPGEAAKEPDPVAAGDDADGVGIPRQQSPEETADSEAADEGART